MMNQRGNILFLILLAVVLFAALSYAVTSSMRGGGKDASAEKSRAVAAQIVQTGTSFENAIMRMKLVNGCKDTEISFENPSVSGYTNNTAPSDKRCHVFDPAGGGMSFPQPPNDLSTYAYWFTGYNTLLDVGGTSLPELMIGLPVPTLALCDAINAGFGNPASLAIDFLHSTKFDGTYTNGNTMPDNGGNASGYLNKPVACVQTIAQPACGPCYAHVNAPYFYYHVLIMR